MENSLLLLSKVESQYKNQIFCAILSIFMSLTFVTYFLVVPIIPTIALKYNIPLGVAWQLSTTYEIGKCVGVVVLGAIAVNKNPLYYMLRAFGFYSILTIIMAAYLKWNEEKSLASLTGLFLIYFAISFFCVASQFGLAVLKIASSNESEFRQWIVFQGLIAACLQSLCPLIGSSFITDFGLESPFIIMCGFGMTGLTFIWYFQPVFLDEDSQDANKSITNISYFKQMWYLLTSTNHRSFQAFSLALCSSTAALYVIPLTTFVGYRTTCGTNMCATWYVLISFIPNIVFRCIPILHMGQFMPTEESFVKLGLILLVIGNFLWLAITITVSTFSAWMILLPSLVSMAGIGSTMPNCKVGIMLGVPKEYGSTANSVLKLSQLISVAITQLLSGIVAIGSTAVIMRNQAILLLFVNAVAFVCTNILKKHPQSFSGYVELPSDVLQKSGINSVSKRREYELL